jgi:membrane protein YdbS with pleckstrin-like domain
MKFEIGLSTLLTIIFIVLKLCGVIQWAWWWVLSPLWGSVAIFIIVTAFVCLCGFIAETIEEKKRKNKEKKHE